MAYKDINIYKYLRFLVKRKLYFFIQRLEPIWRFINKEGVKEFYNIVFSSKELKIANCLKKEGFAVFDIYDLFEESAETIFTDLKKRVEILKNNPEILANKKGSKDFFTHLSGVPPLLDIESPEIKLAYSAPLLNIASLYFGFVPRLHNTGFILTHTIPEGAKPAHSQRWHRDPEDKKILKVFVYLSDVDEGAGPLHYVSESNHKGKWRRVFPQEPPAGSYPPEGAVEKKIPPKYIKRGVGKAGTIVFGDTSGLHKGGYATQKERLQLWIGYVSLASFSPPKFIYPENFEEKIKALGSIQRYALKKWPS
ncbi:MAG: hypothetical protein AAB522_01020 [Patescibacteria group bacterium]